MEPLVKLPFLFLYVLSVHIASIRPQPPVAEKKKALRGIREFIIPRAALIGTICVDIAAIVETTLILKQSISPPEAEIRSLYLTPTAVVGTLMAMATGYIRYWSTATLGTMFTFEVTIQENHKLITDGPYGIVRHPAYAGSIIGYLGTMLYFLGPGSLQRATMTSAASSYFWSMLPVGLVLVIILHWRRADEEDKLIKNQFGEEWGKWAKKVPYKLYPYIH
ncbi:hypothetical protein JOM56_001167 [Amanita muscaria]